jgi:hypothetical protein
MKTRAIYKYTQNYLHKSSTQALRIQKHNTQYARDSSLRNTDRRRPRQPDTVLQTVHRYVAGITLSHDELTPQSFAAGTRRRHNGTRKSTFRCRYSTQPQRNPHATIRHRNSTQTQRIQPSTLRTIATTNVDQTLSFSMQRELNLRRKLYLQRSVLTGQCSILNTKKTVIRRLKACDRMFEGFRPVAHAGLQRQSYRNILAIHEHSDGNAT